MITSTQATQYIDQALGVGVPSFFVDSAVAKVATVDLSVYPDYDQVLMQAMAVAIIAASGSPRRIDDQRASSGASRGFKYADGDLSALRRALAAMDTDGLLTDVVGPDVIAATLFMVV